MSRIAMNMPRHIKMKPNQVATLAWVVLQIGVALAADADFSICGNGKLRDGNGPRCNSRPARGCTPLASVDCRPPNASCAGSTVSRTRCGILHAAPQSRDRNE